jgi:excisionase family DNA binding protein
MSSIPEVLSPQQVAEYLQLTPDTVYRYIRDGKLVASRLGRQYRILRRNVEAFLLVTSTAGDARLRRFPPSQVEAWLAEDEISDETREIGKQLLDSLSSPRGADL